MFQPVMLSQLTQMENVVVGQVLRGKANKSIASELILSQRTIEAHRANAFQKMRVRNAVELTRFLPTAHFMKVPYHEADRHTGPVWFSSSEMESTSG